MLSCKTENFFFVGIPKRFDIWSWSYDARSGSSVGIVSWTCDWVEKLFSWALAGKKKNILMIGLCPTTTGELITWFVTSVAKFVIGGRRGYIFSLSSSFLIQNWCTSFHVQSVLRPLRVIWSVEDLTHYISYQYGEKIIIKGSKRDACGTPQRTFIKIYSLWSVFTNLLSVIQAALTSVIYNPTNTIPFKLFCEYMMISSIKSLF